MKFLVTGGAGFIGSHIVEYLVKRKDSVTVLDNLNTGKIENLKNVKNDIDFVQGDIRDSKLLEKICSDVNGVFHEAALASVQDSFSKQDEYHDVNVNGTENIFRVAQKFGFKVVYASSSSVYGDPKRIPVREEDPKNPINPYAQTKLDDEILAEKYAKMGTRIIGLRYFNVFGERQSKEYAGVIKLFIERVLENKQPKINGDGLQIRDFVFVGDVVKANVLAMESKIDHAFFNVGTGIAVSILDLANIIINAAGLDIKPIHGPALKGDVRQTKADNSLIKQSLKWEPEIRFDDWLIETINKVKQGSVII
jgi:UDP-glucose 4-epimerase